MRTTLHLAAALLLTAAAAASAQVYNPNNLIAPPPPPIQFHGTHVAINPDLQWLWQYTKPAPNGNEAALLADPHFQSMLHNYLKAPQSFYQDGHLPLAEVAHRYFGAASSPVHGIDNRYITFASCVPDDCDRKALLWADTAPQHPYLVFAATEWTTQGKPQSDPDADFNLWLFSSRAINAAQPPASLVDAIRLWNQQHIKTALLIDPDGTPHKINPADFGATPSKP
jgi:hypothetical protein